MAQVESLEAQGKGPTNRRKIKGGLKSQYNRETSKMGLVVFKNMLGKAVRQIQVKWM